MPIPDSVAVCREIIDRILSAEEPPDRDAINRIKNSVCGRYGLPSVPSNVDILRHASPDEFKLLRRLLYKRPVRTISGVAVIAVMTHPQACPHGRCVYCPGGPTMGVPQSYTGHEPATMRGIEHHFDPFAQVSSRITQLRQIGHPVQKAELIVMGGDWCSKEREYREGFVKSCLDAMNGCISKDLEEARLKNETAPVRNIGTTFETRPDCVTPKSIDEMLEMGATRVEIGVQTLSDHILRLVERGHDSEAIARATKLLRDSGLKVGYHIMPGLPGADIASDLMTFETIFSDPRFRPDMLKIYPTLVVKGTKLYEWWRAGLYHPYTDEEIVRLVAEAISKMPAYVRIQRIQRDIPLHQIEAGLKKGNLRELVYREMERLGLKDPTLRYREVGHYALRTGQSVSPEDIKLSCKRYEASDGIEHFLTIEDSREDIVIGFLRLRSPSEAAHRPEVRDRPSVIIRELRVCGPMIEVGRRDPDAWQHTGIGRMLINEAERIGLEEHDARRILVNSGLGVKSYYRSLGFIDMGPYLGKDL